MRSKSIEELREIAKEVFERNPDVKNVLATVDGHIFFEHHRNSCELHARQAGGDRPLVIYEIKRDEAFGKKAKAVQPAKKDAPGKDAKGKDDPTGDNETGEDKEEDPDDKGDGKSPEELVLEKALENDVVKKAGSYFKFGEVNLGQGKQKAIETLLAEPTLKTAIESEIEKLTV